MRNVAIIRAKRTHTHAREGCCINPSHVSSLSLSFCLSPSFPVSLLATISWQRSSSVCHIILILYNCIMWGGKSTDTVQREREKEWEWGGARIKFLCCWPSFLGSTNSIKCLLVANAANHQLKTENCQLQLSLATG